MAGKPMRIMLLVNEFPPERIAGTAMATRALAENLAAKGHRVLVLVTTSCPDEKRHLIAPGDYELVWTKPRPWRGTGFLWRLWHAWREARRFRPQIIQGQAVSCGLLAGAIGRSLGIPSLCYAQGYDVYQSTPLQQRTEIRWGCGWPDACFAVTRHLAAEIQRVTGIADVQVLPHAFALPEDVPERSAARELCGIGPAERAVFCVGRLETFKGHDVLLDAWPGFVAAHPEARLYIAGSGSRLEMLKKQAMDMKLDASLRFVGYLSAVQVHQWMSAADLFVLPSRSEPFGIVLLEAMAHGLPVVASDVGGIPEVVPEIGDVRLVPADEPDALQAAMRAVCDTAFASSEQNRQHAMRFEWGFQVGRFEAIYGKLIEETMGGENHA